MQQTATKPEHNSQYPGSTSVQLKMDRTLAPPLNAYQNQDVWLRLLIERAMHGLAITLLLLPTAIRQKYLYIYICTFLFLPLMHLLAYFIDALQPFSAPIVPECQVSHASARLGLFQKRDIK